MARLVGRPLRLADVVVDSVVTDSDVTAVT